MASTSNVFREINSGICSPAANQQLNLIGGAFKVSLHRRTAWYAFVIVAFVTGTALQARADTLHVPGDFASIQACIDAAVSGQDECVVAPGTYNELINFNGKAITLRSSDGPDVTIIDAGPVPESPGGKSVVRCVSDEGSDTVLEGFTITGGTGSSCLFSGSSTCGGGMFVVGASPTVTDCTFTGNIVVFRGGGIYNAVGSNPAVTNCTFNQNTAAFGGAMYNLDGSSPTVSYCVFSGNTADFGAAMVNDTGSNSTVTNSVFSGNSATAGGAMYNTDSDPTLAGCSFSGNTAALGGGLHNSVSSPTITNCAFSENSATEGGGISNAHSSSPTLLYCAFIGNSAANGGGMFNAASSSPTMIYCTFMKNSTSGQFGPFGGGGMHNWYGSSPTLTGCTFSGNSANMGGGMYNRTDSSPTVTNCTFTGNVAALGGGGMYNWQASNPNVANSTFVGNVADFGGAMFNTDHAGLHAAPAVANSVFWGNTPDELVDNLGAVTTVSYSNVQSGWPGIGNIDFAPMLVRNPSDGGDGWGDDPDTPGVDEGANDDFGDLRLLFGSPCIDTGDGASLPPDVADLDEDGDVVEAIPFDLDGHARVLCSVVDMGAYEFGIGDDDCDGNVDLSDFGVFFDCITGPEGGLPPTCEPFDLDGDSDVDVADAAIMFRLFESP